MPDEAKTGSFRECLQRVHEAGGKAWDDIPDPDALIRYWRGGDDPAAVAAGEAFDKQQQQRSPANDDESDHVL